MEARALACVPLKLGCVHSIHMPFCFWPALFLSAWESRGGEPRRRAEEESRGGERRRRGEQRALRKQGRAGEVARLGEHRPEVELGLADGVVGADEVLIPHLHMKRREGERR